MDTQRLRPYVLSLLRVVVGLLYLQHGASKLLGFPHNASYDNLRLFSLIGVAGVLELIGSVLLVVGLYTRLVAFILSGEMAFAYFMAHAPRNFFPLLNGGEDAVLFCFVFLYFAVAGGGPLSLDATLTPRRARAYSTGN